MQLRANGDCILSGTALSPAFRTKYCEVVATRFGALNCQSLLRDLTPYSFFSGPSIRPVFHSRIPVVMLPRNAKSKTQMLVPKSRKVNPPIQPTKNDAIQQDAMDATINFLVGTKSRSPTSKATSPAGCVYCSDSPTTRTNTSDPCWQCW
jgi:hypothetical protein